MDDSLARRSGRLAAQEPPPLTAFTEEDLRIKKLITDELAQSGTTKVNWTGFVLEATYPELTGAWATYRKDAGDAVKIAANAVGAVAGCHTCLTIAATDADQPWIGDHCPPTELNEQARLLLDCRSKTYLFPQCAPCSQQQSGLVSSLNKTRTGKMPGVVDALDDDERNLLTGTKQPVASGVNQNCVISTADYVKPGEGLEIQRLGGSQQQQGCHTCGTAYPQPNYIADHVVPKAFVTDGMRQLFVVLGIAFPPLLFRPQCQRCSAGQGGAVSSIVVKVRDYAQRRHGIVFVETQM